MWTEKNIIERMVDTEVSNIIDKTKLESNAKVADINKVNEYNIKISMIDKFYLFAFSIFVFYTISSFSIYFLLYRGKPNNKIMLNTMNIIFIVMLLIYAGNFFIYLLVRFKYYKEREKLHNNNYGKNAIAIVSNMLGIFIAIMLLIISLLRIISYIIIIRDN
jgi:hypothetical protein